jgi:hypothetical protein
MQSALLRAAARLPRAAASAAGMRVVAPAAQLVAARAFAGVPAKGGKGKAKEEPMDLYSVLDREIAYEKEEGSSEGTLAEVKESLKEWKFDDEVGSARFSLSKKVRRMRRKSSHGTFFRPAMQEAQRRRAPLRRSGPGPGWNMNAAAAPPRLRAAPSAPVRSTRRRP